MRSLPPWLVLVALFAFAAVPVPGASADPACQRCADGVCVCWKAGRRSGWSVLESRQFRIHFVGKSAPVEPLVPLCERTRSGLCDRWLTPKDRADWRPKCDVYLYPSGKEFERLTRVPQDGWGFADLAVGGGQVWTRALHLRADDEEKLEAVLVHELTHVVLAARFAQKPIPRWADEGIAVLSEPAARRSEQRQALVEEADRQRLFRLRDLTRMQHIPQDRRQSELFYAQSGAFVEFLLTERQLSEARLMSFIEQCDRQGWEAAVARSLPDTTPQKLEDAWRDWLIRGRESVAATHEMAAETGPPSPLD